MMPRCDWQLYPETERTIRRLSLLRLRDLDLLSALPSDTVATKCVLGPETSKDSPEYVVMYGDTRYDEADKEAAAEPPATVVLNGRTVIHPESKRRFYWDLFSEWLYNAIAKAAQLLSCVNA